MPPIGLILSALTGIPQLIDAGTTIYNAITGNSQPSPTDHATLSAAVQALPPDQQVQWVSQMQAQLSQYKAESDRLVGDQGSVDAATLATLPPDAARRIAILRMSTRPWCVRMSMHGMVLPLYAWAVEKVEALIALGVAAAGGAIKFPPIFADFAAGNAFSAAYGSLVPYFASIVGGYILLREVSAGNGSEPGGGLNGAIGTVVNTVASLAKGLRK